MLKRFSLYINIRRVRLNKTYKNLIALFVLVFVIVLIKLLFFTKKYEEIKLYYELCNQYPNNLSKDLCNKHLKNSLDIFYFILFLFRKKSKTNQRKRSEFDAIRYRN